MSLQSMDKIGILGERLRDNGVPRLREEQNPRKEERRRDNNEGSKTPFNCLEFF